MISLTHLIWNLLLGGQTYAVTVSEKRQQSNGCVTGTNRCSHHRCQCHCDQIRQPERATSECGTQTSSSEDYLSKLSRCSSREDQEGLVGEELPKRKRRKRERKEKMDRRYASATHNMLYGGAGRGIIAASNSHFENEEHAAANQWAAGLRRGQANRKGVSNDVLDGILHQLQRIWLDDRIVSKKAKTEALYKCLESTLKSDPNPWESALYLFTSAEDYCQAKASTLSFQILNEFQKWVTTDESMQLKMLTEKFLSEDLRTRVYYATTGKHLSYFNTAVKAYWLDHPGNEFFLPMAKAMIARNKLTEAAQIISKLGLQSHFPQEEVMMPLLFTDKVNVLETYVTGHQEQQRLLLVLLDHLCARTTDIMAFATGNGVKNVKGEKLSKKVLSKFAMRLIKLFDIPVEMCPNITENRAMGAVRYLLYKYYIEKSMAYNSWCDMVESAVGENKNLQVQLTSELLGYNEVMEALKWADRFHLEDSLLDSTVVDARAKQREAELRLSSSPPVHPDRGLQTDEDWDAEVEDKDRKTFCMYYLLPLPDSGVTIVTNREDLHKCLNRITKPFTTIGIDAEWKPAMGKSSERVAVVQLAVEEHVYLLDCVELRTQLVDDEWGQIASSVFCNKNVIKVGFGLATDLRMLSKSFPSMENSLLKLVRVVDLEKLAKKVLVDYDSGIVDPSKGDKAGEGRGNKTTSPTAVLKQEEKGLSLLTMKTLGKPLSKAEQMSNWEKRPLRPSQITYAAADAYVLLEIYNKLCALGLNMGMSKAELEPSVTLHMKTSMDKRKAKAAKANRKMESRMRSGFRRVGWRGPLKPGDLRVVCDTMLQGLGSQLRTCGVDTYIMGNNARHVDAIELCRRENRIVLTTKGPFDQIRANVGEAMCYCVDCSKNAREQCLDVLQYFSVKVNKEDIFSRCSVCNNADFAILPSRDMESLFLYNLRQQQQHWMSGACHSSLSLYEVDQDIRSRFLEYGIDAASISFLHNRVRIQVETVPKQEAFAKIQEFFVCTVCGKVYWEGSHFDRVCTQFEQVLRLNPTQAAAESSGMVAEEGLLYDEDYYEDDSYNPYGYGDSVSAEGGGWVKQW